MATVKANCKKCNLAHTQITSFLPIEKIKLVFYCKGCQALNGFFFKFIDKNTTEVIGSYQASVPLAIPFVNDANEDREDVIAVE